MQIHVNMIQIMHEEKIYQFLSSTVVIHDLFSGNLVDINFSYMIQKPFLTCLVALFSSFVVSILFNINGIK